VRSNFTSLEDYGRALLTLAAEVKRVTPSLPAPSRLVLEAALARADLATLEEDLPAVLDESRVGLDRVTRIVATLKDFARVDAPGAQLDLRAAAEAALGVSNATRHNVSVVTRLEPTSFVRCDAGQVNQSLLALISNAVLAVRERGAGTVTVATGVLADGVFVDVEDTGVGMPADVLARATEPFFTTRPVGRGVGLGLTTADSCARAHGGRLELSSQPGQGTRVRLWLPREPPVEIAAQPLRNEFNERRYS
jgi:signal transduction histidine kinase